MKKVTIFQQTLSIPDIILPFTHVDYPDLSITTIEISDLSIELDVDRKISEYVDIVISQNPDVIFIPTTFGEPSLYYGISLVLHLRFDKSNFFNSIPIVIMGCEDVGSFLINCSRSFILKTKNSYYIEFNEVEFLKIIKQLNYVKNSGELDIANYKIVPPNNLTNHSIVNEWCVLRWANTLNINDARIEQIQRGISSSLYFKFLSKAHPVSAIKKIPDFVFLGAGKVLLIDDDVSLGWDIIFSSFLKENFRSYGSKFKYWTKDMIIDRSLNEVKNFEPDVVVLDLRLHFSDLHNQDPKKFTGLQVLSGIKQLNKGIQVIIFSATGKISNLVELLSNDIDGFVMKETPVLSSEVGFSENAVSLLLSSIDCAMRMSFLKTIRNKCLEIELITQDQTKKPQSLDLLNYYDRIYDSVQVAFDLARRSKVNSIFLNYSFVQFFQIIEDFSGLPSVYFRNGNSVFVVCKDKRVHVLESFLDKKGKEHFDSCISFNQKKGCYDFGRSEVDSFYERTINFRINVLLVFRYGNQFDVHNWNNLNAKRNLLTHGNQSYADVDDIIKLLDFIIFLLNENNISDANSLLGL